MNPKPPGASLPVLSGPPKAKDPVCGMSVDPSKVPDQVEHGGKAYYFCSKRCAERFAQDPEKFLLAPGTAGMERDGHLYTRKVGAHTPTLAEREAKGHAAAEIAPAAVVPSSAQGVRYTCPMDPEIVQI